MAYTPVELTKDGKTTFAMNIEEEVELLFDGWVRVGAVPRDDSQDVVRRGELRTPSSQPMVDLKAAYAPVGAATTRLRMVALGDSTAAGGLMDASGVPVDAIAGGYSFPAPYLIGREQAGPLSWATHAALRSGGRLLLVHNAGSANDTSTGCLARFSADVVPYRPDIVMISGGVHNDVVGSVATATTRANIVGMIRAARAAGIQPILVTAYPENNATYAAALRKHNAWLKILAAGRDAAYADIAGLIVVDPYAAVVDPASSTGAWLAGYTSDGTHANGPGAVAAADKILADLGGLLRGNSNPSAGPFASWDNVQGSPNLWLNGLMTADSNSDGSPDGMGGGTPAGTTHAMSTVAGVPGKVYDATIITPGGGGRFQQFTVDGTTIKAGDRLKWSGLARATANAGALVWYLALLFPGETPASYPIQPILGVDYPLFYFECEAVVPAGATEVQAGIYCVQGTGSMGLAQQSLINLSTGL